MDDYREATALPEQKYQSIPKRNLIVFGIYSVTKNGEGCSFERLVRECFTLFPKAFGFSRYPQWPDSLKFDRQVRELCKKGWIVGDAKTTISLTKFGEKIAEETKQMLTGSKLNRKVNQKHLRGADTALIHSLKESIAFKKFLGDRERVSISEMELRSLLRCTLETPLKVLEQNLQYGKNLANDYSEKDLFDFLEACEQILATKVKVKQNGI